MLCEKFKSKDELNIKTGCRIFSDISDREFWENIEYIDFFEENAAKNAKEGRKILTASLYREFAINGNRSNYEDIYFARRIELICKVILECFYNDGRYMDDITDLVWMILEETTWTIPAHNTEVKTADSLPDFEHHSLDLFLAETACIMAFVYQVIGIKLDSVSRNITGRIKARLKNDVIDDYLSRDDYWWLATGEGNINNWTPWVNSNVLAVALIIEDDEETLRNVVYKAMRSVDRYLNKYPFDGACDEGPSYWNQAGLSALDSLWLLNIVTDGQIDFFREEKIVNMLEYFMKVYTGKGECVNFSDSAAKVPVHYESIYKYAKIVGDRDVILFAKHLYDTLKVCGQLELSRIFKTYDKLVYARELKAMEKAEFEPESDYYFESTQVMISKAGANPEKGLFIAAKGGHNDENHNHNDVGSFVVYKNGIKFLVDSGNMTYSKITFSPDRYTLWTTRSTHHNLPVIGGKEQKFGREYAAKNVTYEKIGNKVYFSLDIKDAYENRDEIEKWVRSFEYDKEKQEIKVTEDFAFEKEFACDINFLTPHEVQENENGFILTSENGEKLELTLNTADFEFNKETIDIDDRILLNNWGSKLHRISLKFKSKQNVLEYVIK